MGAAMADRVGDPRLHSDSWWKVNEDKERQRAQAAEEAAARLAKERASIPVPTHSDWGQRFDEEMAERMRRLGPAI
jgi:hypothetical protein